MGTESDVKVSPSCLERPENMTCPCAPCFEKSGSRVKARVQPQMKRLFHEKYYIIIPHISIRCHGHGMLHHGSRLIGPCSFDCVASQSTSTQSEETRVSTRCCHCSSSHRF